MECNKDQHTQMLRKQITLKQIKSLCVTRCHTTSTATDCKLAAHNNLRLLKNRHASTFHPVLFKPFLS